MDGGRCCHGFTTVTWHAAAQRRGISAARMIMSVEDVGGVGDNPAG